MRIWMLVLALAAMDVAIVTAAQEEATPRGESGPIDVLYVAPDGKADAPGTKEAPLSLAGVCVKKDVAPGTVIYLRDAR